MLQNRSNPFFLEKKWLSVQDKDILYCFYNLQLSSRSEAPPAEREASGRPLEGV